MLPRISPLVVAALLVGCNSLPEPVSPRVAAPAPPSRDVMQAMQMTAYALDLKTVVQGNPTEQAEVMASARAGYEQARQGPAVLRYALLLAAPGHPLRDLVQAQRLLNEALAPDGLLSPGERALAEVEQQRVDDALRLVMENERLVAEAQRERERQRNAPSLSALNKRLQTEAEETARLRKDLADAKAKLDAIADIERRISDRPPATDRPPPAIEGRKP